MNNTNRNVFYKYGIFVILILALILRLIGIDRSFSNDELSAISRLGFTEFSSLISLGVMTDGHPAFTQVFLWFWIKLFPMTEVSIRLPFVISSVFTMYFTYRFAEIISLKKVGILVVSIMTISAYYIDYSWLARPYSIGFLWSILSFYFGIKASKNYQIQSWILYVIFTVFAMYTHYFSFLSVFVFSLFLLVFLKENNRKYLLISGVICAVLFLPHLSVTIHQLSYGGVGGWLGKPGNDFLYQYVFTIFNQNWLFVSVFFGLYFLVFLKQKLWKSISVKKINSIFLILFSTFFLVFFIGFFYSKYVNAVLQYSVLIFCSPLLFIVLFYWLKNASDNAIKMLTGIILVFGFVSLIYPKSYYKINRFAVFKDIAEHAEKDLKNKSTQMFFNGNGPFYFQFYANGIDSNQWNFIHFNEQFSLKDFEQKISEINTENFIYAWSNVGNPPAVLSIIQQYFPYPVHHYYWLNSEYFLFSKNSNLQEKNFYFLKEIQVDSTAQNTEFINVFESSQKELDIKAFSNLAFNIEIELDEIIDLENTFAVVERVNAKTNEIIYYNASNFEITRKSTDDNFNGKYLAKVGAFIDQQNDDDITLKIYVWNKNKAPIKLISAEMQRWKENEILF